MHRAAAGQIALLASGGGRAAAIAHHTQLDRQDDVERCAPCNDMNAGCADRPHHDHT